MQQSLFCYCGNSLYGVGFGYNLKCMRVDKSHPLVQTNMSGGQMEANMEIRNEIALAMAAGLSEVLAGIKERNGTRLTEQKRNELRDELNRQLVKEFEQYFIQARMTQTDAKSMVSYIVDKELEKL
jgi:hypothetical protein